MLRTSLPHKEAPQPLAVAGGESYAHIPRAPRFPIQTPVYYRVNGGQGWQQGMTVNISRTGMLFQGESDLEPNTTFVARILFPAELTGTSPTCVLCRATIARTESDESADGRTTVAAAISHCRFLRPDQAD